MDRKHRQLYSNIAATSADERKQREQHRSVGFNISNMLKQSNMRVVVREDFQETPPTSVASFSSVKSDEKLNRYVLKIDIVPQQQVQSAKCCEEEAGKVENREQKKSNHISVMSINQECNSRVMMVPSSFDGNLSDDQKLVLNISADGTSSICGVAKAKNINRIMLSDSFSNSDDHLDSGTCSDADINVFHSPTSESPQPPPLPPKLNGKSRQKDQMLSDSFYSDASSASSSDSMQYNGSLTIHSNGNHHLVSPDLIRSIGDHHSNLTSKNSCRVIGSDADDQNNSPLPISLLMDIRSRSMKFNDEDGDDEEDDELTTSDENEDHELILCNRENSDEKLMIFSEDKSYKFHMNEHLSNNLEDIHIMAHDESDENFAGYKDINCRTATIRSAKGTIRGVKNRVRNGIKTFLLNNSTTVRVSSGSICRQNSLVEFFEFNNA